MRNVTTLTSLYGKLYNKFSREPHKEWSLISIIKHYVSFTGFIALQLFHAYAIIKSKNKSTSSKKQTLYIVKYSVNNVIW